MLRTTTLTCFLALALTACIESGGGGGGNGPAPAATGDLAQTLTARVEQNLSTLDELLSIAKTLPMGGEIEDAERPDIEELRAWLEDEANIESKSAAKIVYRVRPEEMCDEETVAKVQVFIGAAKKVASLFEKGATREEIGERVSPEGRERFWAHWPE